MLYSYPEAARERDLHRYYRPWLNAQSLVDADGSGSKGLTYEGYRPQTSRDRSLTAFAQLAALRLDTRRAMVSLIDSNRQYILAEATRTLALCSPTAERPEDEVWLGNAILNKTDAVCYHTFSATYTATETNGDTITADCMVIPDCRLDPRFADKDYVKGEPGVRFYAGVPITTKAGNRIGVYAVSDEKPRAGLTAAEMRFMQDVAAAVMEHLELAKDRDDRTKGERMVRGLTQFIERSTTQDSRDDGNRPPTTMEKQTENARLETLEEEGPAATVLTAASRQAHHKHEALSDVARVFHRAARIMRQSTDADGVVFFDTSAAGIKRHEYDDNRSPGTSDEDPAHTTTDFETGDSTATSRRRKRQDVHFDPTAHLHTHSKACPVAGLSLREGTAARVHTDFAFTEAAMERYIHRYPCGKFFNYSDEGVGFNSSDEKSQTSETDHSDPTKREPTATPKRRKRKERFIPTEFLKVLPNVRTLIFLPLWDPASERWVAGGFIWTTQAGRLMSPENELPYLQAFGNSITSEVARLSAQKSDRAKTTFIASISHELRSPLHGILGSVEFLRDTVSSAYQESLVSSIEICGKTLLDTIDHVLDYAKINKLRNTTPRRKQRGEGRSKRSPADNSILGVTADFDLAQLVEEVCDTVCAGHTFRKTRNSHTGGIYDQAEQTYSNVMGGEEDEQKKNGAVLEGRDTHGSVIVSLIVAPNVNWIVRSQPGALRRIVMNLLGNALKYTDSGFIAVSMTQSSSGPQLIDFSLTVEDSGRGMSAEYQKSKLFAPFSQEDPFSSGTGLGLSIVKQIVESFKGDIEVKSTVHVGSQIKVSMRLPSGQTEDVKQTHALLPASNKLRETSVCISCEPDTRGGERGVKTKESMHKACQGFGMKIAQGPSPSIADVDFLLTDSPSLDQLLREPGASRVDKPLLCVVCICTDTAEKTAVEQRLGPQISALGWIAEIVTQPCGPRKLARLLLACRKRASTQETERHLTRSKSTFAVPRHQSLAPPTTLIHRSLSDILQKPSPPALPPTSQTEYFPPRVLLVDDNAINLKLLVVFAQRQSLRYEQASNGLDALDIFKREALVTSPPTRPFDYVLMDLSMPVMDGLTSTRGIRAFEGKMGLQRSQIVALTGLASAQDQRDAGEAGVDLYLVKPVKFADIRRVFGAR
ncbi:hypothetical protein P153DRAFT_317851 [Dothidotthia symphoricarpi CBS 119687]|uniref:histidine kinase n=1 Tax=Dothidotthia symphoricarpi CBS 119687 TaxID=1392245 RepID=A0A6A6ABL9_9PLEO|nr:uncharacterized protein P153DRAFT_317851 [Dothidotthia symphoricarpi CBS 119687]KAF2129179.1 hypothetical protein P153DRAFT_317851 [Dothidotthia symphoricarpi CBS 119687]